MTPAQTKTHAHGAGADPRVDEGDRSDEVDRSRRPAGYVHFTRTSGVDLWARLDVAQQRFTRLIAEADPTTAIPGATWTIGEVAAHVLSVLRRYTLRDLRKWDGLAADAAGVVELNDAQMRELAGTSPTVLVDAIDEEMDRIRVLLPASVDLTERFPFHSGLTVDGAGMLANLIGELLVHGRDIALATGREFGIDDHDALLVLNELVQLPAGFMRAEARPVKVGFRIRGAVPWVFEMEPGTARSRPLLVGEHTDVLLRGPAHILVLAIYGRYSVGAALRRGLIATGGRRPWRAFRVVANIHNV